MDFCDNRVIVAVIVMVMMYFLCFWKGGEDQKKAHLSVGASSEVSLKVTEADISNLTASIRSPSGLEEPCILKRLANGHLGECRVFSFHVCSCHKTAISESYYHYIIQVNYEPPPSYFMILHDLVLKCFRKLQFMTIVFLVIVMVEYAVVIVVV